MVWYLQIWCDVPCGVMIICIRICICACETIIRWLLFYSTPCLILTHFVCTKWKNVLPRAYSGSISLLLKIENNFRIDRAPGCDFHWLLWFMWFYLICIILIFRFIMNKHQTQTNWALYVSYIRNTRREKQLDQRQKE